MGEVFIVKRYNIWQASHKLPVQFWLNILKFIYILLFIIIINIQTVGNTKK
jgi:amino acid permease